MQKWLCRAMVCEPDNRDTVHVLLSILAVWTVISCVLAVAVGALLARRPLTAQPATIGTGRRAA